jgi:phosphohistidine phosphatase
MLLRHGKSDWNAGPGADIDRPLSRRGVRAARTMGIVLEKMGETPDRVFTSPAVRAASTASLAAASGRWHTVPEVVAELYGTGPAGALAVAAEGGSAPRLMLVGHEPTWSLLARRITGGSIIVKTGTVLAFDLPIESWADAADVHGALAYALHPRMFDDDWIPT